MYRILIGGFSHETNSFCPLPADRAAFELRRFFFGEEIFRKIAGEENEINGFLQVLGNNPDYRLIPSLLFSTGPSGPVTKEIYDLALNSLLKLLAEEAPFDGIFLSMHGAMVAEGHPDAEGDFLEALRKAVGKEIPVIVTLDLHGNITKKMADNATALIPCEEYPHTDCYPLGQDAARLMKDTIEGHCRPVMAYRSVPYLLPLFPTALPEIAPFLRQARACQKQPGVRFARIAHGFFPANIPEMGMSVMVVTDNDPVLAERLAQELADTLWQGRGSLRRRYLTLDEALDLLKEDLGGPLVLGDGSDNPGAGGLCDTTHILRRILERGITGAAIGVIRDPANVEKCRQAGEGAAVTLWIGGQSDPRLSGGPLKVTGMVEGLCDGRYHNRDAMERGLLVDMGPTAVLQTAGNRVILTTYRNQLLDAEGFRCCGIQPEKQKILAVKSAVHYRASFGRFAGRLADLALPGYSAPDPEIFRSLGFPLIEPGKE